MTDDPGQGARRRRPPRSAAVEAPVLEAPLWEQHAATAAAEGDRLQKVMAGRGFASRRACEDLIQAGRVTVNGAVAVLGRRVRPDDVIAVDGTPCLLYTSDAADE